MKYITTKILAVAFFGLFVGNLAFAESNSSFETDSGSAVLFCERSEPVPVADFAKVFGQWQTYIMKKHEEGVVYLSQYLQAINKGIVVVINKHHAAADNVKEAKEMLNEMNKIAKDMGVEREKNSCRIMVMGAIWLPPKK